MPIGQISFMRMDGPVEHAYGASEAGSKYQGQAEPTRQPLLPELPQGEARTGAGARRRGVSAR